MRPHVVSSGVWDRCMSFFPMWLRERGGIAVYENHNFDSSAFGQMSFMPMRFQAEDDTWHDAPEEHRPGGGVPSLRQQRIDIVKLDEFDGDVETCIAACFKMQVVHDDEPDFRRKRRKR